MDNRKPFLLEFSSNIPADEFDDYLARINWHNQQINKLLRGELDPEQFLDASEMIEGLIVDDYLDNILENLDIFNFYHALRLKHLDQLRSC